MGAGRQSAGLQHHDFTFAAARVENHPRPLCGFSRPGRGLQDQAVALLQCRDQIRLTFCDRQVHSADKLEQKFRVGSAVNLITVHKHLDNRPVIHPPVGTASGRNLVGGRKILHPVITGKALLHL